MKFLVDQAASWRVARDLARAGHDAIHVRDIGLADADDPIILERALAEDRVIVTQDTDYGTLLAAAHARRPAVVLLRMRDGRPETHARALGDALPMVAAELERGAIVVIGEDAIRIRRLPIV